MPDEQESCRNPIEPIRNPDGTFPKGVSGNPNGRPKGSVSLVTVLRRRLASDEGITADELVDEVIAAAKMGDAHARKLLWEYSEGKPTQPIDGNIDATVRIVDDV